MILSDRAILERMESRGMKDASDPSRIEIDPFNLDDLQGASVDLRLGAEVIYHGVHINLVEDERGLLLTPRGVCLAQTSARIHTPHDCVARVEGKSSIGRQFVVVHCTAGWLDPGFDGYITLEIANLSNITSFLLEPNMPICQLTFLQMDQPAHRQYKGKYQFAKGVEAHKS